MPQGTESTAKFKADISQLKSAMQEASRQVRLANSEFKAATAGMDNWAKSADGLSAKVKQLDSVLGAQKSKLSSLEQQYALVAKEEGESSKGAQELAIKINNQKAVVAKTEAELDKYDKELTDCKNGTGKFATELDQTNKSTKKASDGFTVMKGALASLVADGIKLAITGLKNLTREAVDAYKEFDTGRDNVIKATGATGKAAQSLVDSFSNVSSSIKGDFGSIGSALGELNTRFGFTGSKLEEATKDFIKFSDITGTDAKEAVRLVSRAMGDAGIKSNNYKKVLDQLATASQASGIEVSKLAENLAKYGAPMRALGINTKNSIALFSAWEKAGVNTEIAFSGLKKAISNWGKANKDPKEEFSKTLDEIAKAPNIAKATSKAIEVFGAKAGPDLADAIKGGRFEYSNFVDLLDKSKGKVNKTYNATKDGFDKTELAVQKAKLELGKFVANLANKYQPQIKQAINGVTNFIKSAFNFVAQNANTLKAVIGGLIAAFAAAKIASFVSALVGVIGTIKTLVVSIQAATTAQEAFNIVQAATPWGLVAGLITGVVGGLALYAATTEDATSAAAKNKEEIDELYKSYKEMDKSRADSNNSINAEYDHLEDLKKEYNSYVDDQGKIKKKYQERANFILNQLADAMGVERSEIEKTIGKNGKLGASIDKLMLKKKAQATLDANKSAYDEAIEKQTEAQNKYIKAQKDADKIDQQIIDTKKQLEQAQKNAANSYVQTSTGKQATAETEKYGKEVERLKAILKYLSVEQRSQADAVDKASKAYAGYQATVENWEKLSAAATSGNAKAVKQALLNVQNNFISAKTGTSEALSQQVTDAQKHYKELKNAVKNGYAGVSQEDVNAAKTLVNKSKAELSKWFVNSSEIAKKATAAGVSIPKHLSEGIKNGTVSVETATKRVEAAVRFTNLAKNASASGKKVVNAVVKELLAGKISAKEAAKKLTNAGIKGLEGGEKAAEKEGKAKRNSFVKGIKSDPEGVTSAGKAVAKSAKKGLDTKDSTTNPESSGKNFLHGYITGLQNKNLITKVNKQGLFIGQTAVKNLNKGQKSKSPSKATEKSGIWYGQGYLNGMKAMTKKVLAAAFNMGTGATTALAEAQEEGSPSKITFKSGVNFVKGFIGGIVFEEKTLFNTVKGLVKTATTELLKLNNFNFNQVSQNATESFNNGISKKVSYITDKIAYQNEKKLAEFDKNITAKEKTRDSKIAKIESKRDSVIKRLESERDSKIAKLEKARNKAKSKKRKAELAEDIKDTRNSYNKQIKNTTSSINKQIKAIKSTNSAINKQIKGLNASKEAYNKASSEFLEHLNSAMSSYQSQAEALISDTINGITDTYQAKYDALISKQDNLIEKLKEAGDLFTISGAGVLTIADIKQQTESLVKYGNSLEAIKKKVSAELFDKIAALDIDQGQAFIDQLLKLSEEDLEAYSDAFSKKMLVAQNIATSLYENDFTNVAEQYKKAITNAMATLPGQLETLGQQVFKGFVTGLTSDTDYLSKAVKTLISGMLTTFTTELDIHSPSGVTTDIGENTGGGLVVGLLNMVNAVKSATKQLVNAAAVPLDNITSNIDVAKANVGTSSNTGSGTVITNNYNMVQNNTSPKSLSALDTYKARQQQLAMLKAATSSISRRY